MPATEKNLHISKIVYEIIYLYALKACIFFFSFPVGLLVPAGESQ